MTDTVDRATRSRMMSGIRSRNTKPETILRKALHRVGFRFRLHRADLPGKPDIVLSKYHAVIFVHGCFWHGHGCPLFKLPETRGEFWKSKIEKNVIRDAKKINELVNMGWRVAIVWECTLRSLQKVGSDDLVLILANWLKSSDKRIEIPNQ